MHLAGIKGPGGVILHMPKLAKSLGDVNRVLRAELGLDARLVEVTILATAREMHSQFEWAMHEPVAQELGVPAATIDMIRHGKPRLSRSVRRAERFHPKRRDAIMHEGVESQTYFQWLSQAAPDVQLNHLIAGYRISAAIHVAAELKLADLLAAGPQTSAALAQQTQTHPQAMYRLLRTLASVGLFTEVEPGSFALTALGMLLKTDHPLSMRALTRNAGGRSQWQCFGALRRAVETGGPIAREVLGMSGWEYLNHHPEEREIFNEAMVSIVRQVGDAVVRAYDFSRFQTLVDVGGGYGALLSAILTRTPQLRAVLFDQPEVMPGARTHLESAGVLARCQVVGGDFFQGVPPGGDAYLFSRVIHDWNDERATLLLSHCRRAMPPSGTLLLVEEVLLPGDAPCFGKLMDLNMLVVAGGQERTEAEYRTLYTAAGFELVEVIPTASRMSIIVGVPRAAHEA